MQIFWTGDRILLSYLVQCSVVMMCGLSSCHCAVYLQALMIMPSHSCESVFVVHQFTVDKSALVRPLLCLLLWMLPRVRDYQTAWAEVLVSSG